MKIETLLIHGGIDGDKFTGSVNIPIYQTSTFRQEKMGVHKGYEYSRTGNPTREALEKLIADMEGGKYGLAFASGMAAITAVLSLFKTGDKVLISNSVYGGTFRVLSKVFSDFGINYEMVKVEKSEVLEKKLTSDVKAIIVESPSNPLLEVADIKHIANVAKEKGILTIVDNTFMTPYLQKPLNLGADIVVHSATKYLGGHSDLIAGLVVVKDKELADRLYFIQNSTGGILGPFDSFLLIRGIKTLAVRIDRQEENANYIAENLNNREEIEKVYYPGLKSHIGYKIQKNQANGFGGMISIVLNRGYSYKKFLEALKIIILGESLGGIESLASHPATMTHASIPEDKRKELGIVDNLVRISVGLENKEDLLLDILNALKESKEE